MLLVDRVAGLLGCPSACLVEPASPWGGAAGPFVPGRVCCGAASARDKGEKAEVAGDRPLTGTALSAAPLKGIPKQAPFRSPTTPSVFSPAGNRTPIPPSRTPLRKERGVKVGAPRRGGPRRAGRSALRPVADGGSCLSWQLLDISELDMVGAGREAKRRRKTLGAYGAPTRQVGARRPPGPTEPVSRLSGAFMAHQARRSLKRRPQPAALVRRARSACVSALTCWKGGRGVSPRGAAPGTLTGPSVCRYGGGGEVGQGGDRHRERHARLRGGPGVHAGRAPAAAPPTPAGACCRRVYMCLYIRTYICVRLCMYVCMYMDMYMRGSAG